MEELDTIVKVFFDSLTIRVSDNKKVKTILPNTLDLNIDLKKFENVISNFLIGYSTEEISLKTNISFKEVDEIIDCYNYLYN